MNMPNNVGTKKQIIYLAGSFSGASPTGLTCSSTLVLSKWQRGGRLEHRSLHLQLLSLQLPSFLSSYTRVSWCFSLKYENASEPHDLRNGPSTHSILCTNCRTITCAIFCTRWFAIYLLKKKLPDICGQAVLIGVQRIIKTKAVQ
jgi:hypothetical protein